MTIVVLNESYSTRTRKSGKVVTTIDVISEPLVHDIDAKQLGRGPAEAIAQFLRDRIAGIAERASEATIKRRQSAAKKNDQPRRYSGGRIGPMPPNQSDRLFNDSGRFVRSIVAAAASDRWIINVASNRLSADTLNAGKQGSPQAALEFIKTRLVQLVPELADPRRLMDSIPVRKAIEEGMAAMIKKQKADIAGLKTQRNQAALGLVKQVVGLVL